MGRKNRNAGEPVRRAGKREHAGQDGTGEYEGGLPPELRRQSRTSQ